MNEGVSLAFYRLSDGGFKKSNENFAARQRAQNKLPMDTEFTAAF